MLISMFTSNILIDCPEKILAYGAHIEICRGSPKQNIAYVKKNGNIVYEYGEEPHQGQLTVGDLKNMTRDEVPPRLRRIKDEIDAEEREEREFREMLDKIKRGEELLPVRIVTDEKAIREFFEMLDDIKNGRPTKNKLD